MMGVEFSTKCGKKSQLLMSHSNVMVKKVLKNGKKSQKAQYEQFLKKRHVLLC